MGSQFFRWLGLRPGELGLVFVLSMILFANYATMGITKVLSVSGFLSEIKDQYILLVWAFDMVLLILATAIQSLIIDRFNRVKLLLGILSIFTILYAILPLTFLIKFLPLGAIYTFIYLLNEQQWGFFPIIFWILVTDIFEPAQNRRLMPIIANFAFVGTLVGLGVAAIDVHLKLGSIKLLSLNASIFGLALMIGWLGLRKVKTITTSHHQTSNIKDTLIDGLDFIKTVPVFAYLALSMVTGGIIMTILLYNTLSNLDLGLGNNFQSFYALYSLAIALGSIILQSLGKYLLERIGLRNMFLIQPFIMLLSIIAIFFLPGYWSSASSQGLARINYDTVDLSTRKALQSLSPNEQRGRISVIIDGYLPLLGTIIGSLITFSIISAGIWAGINRELYTSIYLAVGFIVVIVAIYSAFRMRTTYNDSLLNWRLRRRVKAASILKKIDFTED